MICAQEKPPQKTVVRGVHWPSHKKLSHHRELLFEKSKQRTEVCSVPFPTEKVGRVELKPVLTPRARRSYLLSSGTLLPRTQLSCSWTDSGVVCSSAGSAAGGAGLWFLLFVREFLLREVMDGWCWAACCLWGGGSGCRVDWPWLLAGCSENGKGHSLPVCPRTATPTHAARCWGSAARMRMKTCL